MDGPPSFLPFPLPRKSRWEAGAFIPDKSASSLHLSLLKCMLPRVPQLPREGTPRARVPPHLGSGLRPHHTVHSRLHLTFGDHDALPASKQHPESVRLGRSLSATPTCPTPSRPARGPPEYLQGLGHGPVGHSAPALQDLRLQDPGCNCTKTVPGPWPRGRGQGGFVCKVAARGAVLRGGARGFLCTPDRACMLRLQQGGVQPRGQPRGCSEPLGPRAEPLAGQPPTPSDRACGDLRAGQRRPTRGSPNPGPSLPLSGHSRNGPRSRRADTARRRRRPGRRRNPACAPSPRPR